MKQKAIVQLAKRIIRRSGLEVMLAVTTIIAGIIGSIVLPAITADEAYMSLLGLVGGMSIGFLGFLFVGLLICTIQDLVLQIKSMVAKWKIELNDIQDE